jgi:ADP-ribosyltransferase of polymorphic toxin system
VIQTLRMTQPAGADVATVRVRHFTSVSNLSKIQEDNILLAGNHGCVFAVSARGKPPSLRGVERALGISRGRGNAFVDFDAIPGEFEIRVNAR